MFDGEMAGKNSIKKILGLENFWSKTKLDLGNFHQNFSFNKEP